MHVMFIHPNFPAQFGLLAHYLSTQMGWTCTFITSVDTSQLQLPFNHINYRLKENEPQPKVFHNPDSLQGLFDHMIAIYKGLRNLKQITPDLVVGHMSYGTMLYLRNLYSCPFIGYFEMLPAPFWTDGLTLRNEFPPPEGVKLFNAGYHTFTHLHLHACDVAFTPTEFQSSTCPQEWRHKLRVLRDGVDCNLFQPRTRPTTFQGRTFDEGTKVVTYVSRGLESTRGFDIFMKVAKRILAQRQDVVFLIVGAERTNYGHELYHIQNQSFKQWVLSQDNYDPERFVFLNLLPMGELATLFNLTNLHFALTAPYPVSSSVIQAMASGCPIVGSATAPVQEMIQHEVHGLLADLDDVEALTAHAMTLLNDQDRARTLGTAARQRVLERHELGLCLSKMVEFFSEFGKPINPTDEAFASL